MLTVSVVIPSLNSPMIDQVVALLKKQTYRPSEIVVVGRDSHGRLSTLDTAIRFVDTGHPISPAAARNIGVKLCSGEIICFIDADCLPQPDWVERMVARHIGGDQIVGGGVSLPSSGYWTLCDNIAVFADFLDCTSAGERTHLPSLNLSIRRSLFTAIGGFNEVFSPSGEDTDLSLRLRQRGHQLAFEPHARITHHPVRHTIHDLWRHLRVFGNGYVRIQETHMCTIGPSIKFTLCRQYTWLAVLIAPLLALFDTASFYINHPSLMRYWYALAGVAIGRLAWYVGLMFGPPHMIDSAGSNSQ